MFCRASVLLLGLLLLVLSCEGNAFTLTRKHVTKRSTRQPFDEFKTNAAVNAPFGTVIVTSPPESTLKATIRSLAPVLCSSFCVAAIMYPLDLMRALQMANAGASLSTKELLLNFKNAHGINGFFTQGLVPELTRSTWMRFIKFGLFPIMHKIISGLPESQGTAITKAIAAILTSIPEAISIMPLEISKIALQLDTLNIYKNNMFLAMKDYYKKKGLQGFTMGYSGVQYKQAAWSVGYFLSLNFFERHTSNILNNIDQGSFMRKNPKAVRLLNILIAGFLAGVVGAILNTPGDTIRSTIQKRVLSHMSTVVPEGLSTSFFGVGQEIVKSKGISGLYAGFQFKALHLGGGGALMAFLIPFFKAIFERKEPPVTVCYEEK